MKINLKVIVISIVCVGLVVGYYYYLSTRTTKSVENTTELTEVQKVTTTDLETSYPVTPREVVKFYNRILSCYYNETYTAEEFDQLIAQARILMDEELLENNPEEVYRAGLQQEIDSYHADGKTIVNSTVCDSDEVITKTVEGRECAYVEVSYFIKEASSFLKTNETYILRKDENGAWRILAFYIEDSETQSSSEEAYAQ